MCLFIRLLASILITFLKFREAENAGAFRWKTAMLSTYMTYTPVEFRLLNQLRMLFR
jgi:hypothetical protein